MVTSLACLWIPSPVIAAPHLLPPSLSHTLLVIGTCAADSGQGSGRATNGAETADAPGCAELLGTEDMKRGWGVEKGGKGVVFWNLIDEGH